MPDCKHRKQRKDISPWLELSAKAAQDKPVFKISIPTKRSTRLRHSKLYVTMPASSIRALPTELQSRILSYVFEGAELEASEDSKPPCPRDTHHAILLTCHYFFDSPSFWDIYYTRATLRITAWCPRIQHWTSATSSSTTPSPRTNHPRMLQHICHLSLAKNVQTTEADGDEPGRGPRSIFSYFPSLTDVTFDAWTTAEQATAWLVECRHYVPPSDADGFVKLLRNLGGIKPKRPKEVPEGVRCWERHELLVHWKCTDGNCDKMTVEAEAALRCGCHAKAAFRGREGGTELRCVVVECEAEG